MKTFTLTLLVSVLTAAVFTTYSCKKSKEDTKVDSFAIVKNQLLGTWKLDKTETKDKEKCASGPCTILNPDGSVKDTVRRTDTYQNSYWQFTQDSLIREAQRLTYEIIGYHDRIQAYGLDPFLILVLSGQSLVLDGYSRTPTVNDHYHEIYTRYYFSR